MSENKREYLRTTRPASWIVPCAVISLLVVFILWAFTGNVLDLQRIELISCEEGVFGCIDMERSQPEQLRKGMEVVFETREKGSIEYIDSDIHTNEKMIDRFGDTVFAQLNHGTYYLLFPVLTDAELDMDRVYSAWVVKGEIRPIFLWMSGADRE